MGIAVDSKDNVYISDSEAHKVLKVTPQGKISVFAGTGVKENRETLPENADARNVPLHTPTSLAVDSQDNVYILENFRRVLKVTPKGEASVFANRNIRRANPAKPAKRGVRGLIRGLVGNKKSATSMPSETWILPSAMGIDHEDNIYLASDREILKLDPDGTFSAIIPLEEGSVSDFSSLAVDRHGNVYFVEMHHHEAAYKVTPDGTITKIASAAKDGENKEENEGKKRRKIVTPAGESEIGGFGIWG